PESYTFDFGPKELVNLVGLSKSEGNAAMKKLFENSKIKVIDNKIHVTDIEEIDKQAKYYHKMEKIERARRQNAMKNR
ncbi:MAG TPA: cAMP-binding protein, partial [Spirochaetia bacterium]|nr:cAMP-binding protein [Spirochaetia bacterium]